MSETTEFITIIRPSFMRFCKDACRAAAFNHILFRIAGKCKDQPKEKIQAGEITWYAKNEQITSEMSNAWGVCKVRKEVNELIDMGLIGRSKNPKWGVDRTKHFSFGTEQCQKFLQLCQENGICFVHLDLCDEVKHLIYSSNANDKSIKCICSIHQMQAINLSDANDKSIRAIPIEDNKEIHIEDNKEEKASQNGHSPNRDAHASLFSLSLFSDSSVATRKNENDNHFRIADTTTQPTKPKQAPPKQVVKPVEQKPPAKPILELSTGGKLVYEHWCEALNVRTMPLNAALVEAAEMLAELEPTAEDLKAVRIFCYTSNPGWYGKNGKTKGKVTLKDIVKNWEGWKSSQPQQQEQQKPRAAALAPENIANERKRNLLASTAAQRAEMEAAKAVRLAQTGGK